MHTYKDLEVWGKALNLSVEVYKLTKTFPKDELYGITSQIRRSAVSIPSNIAEGFNRSSTKEFIQFLQIALGSSAELDTQLIICNKVGYLNLNLFNELEVALTVVRKMLVGLIKSLKLKNT